MKNECPVCGTVNHDKALVCALCSHLLDRAVHAPPPQPLDPAEMADCAANARRFVLLMTGGLSGWALTLWLAAQGTYPGALDPFFTQPHFNLLMILCALLLLAFGVASTAEACGAPFWPCFLAGLFPPSIPGILARAARLPVAEVYVYLLAEIIAFYLLLLALAHHLDSAAGNLALAGMIALLPLLIYHLCGGGLRELGAGLGLDPWRATAWIALGPVAVALMYLAERHLIHSIYETAPPPLERRVPAERLAAQLFDPAAGGALSRICLAGFILATLFIWLRAVFNSLRNPAGG